MQGILSRLSLLSLPLPTLSSWSLAVPTRRQNRCTSLSPVDYPMVIERLLAWY